MNRQIQSAYDRSAPLPAGPLDDRVYAAMYSYLTQDLGRAPAVAEQRARVEVERRPAEQTCDELEQKGIQIAGKRILDLGAGLGGLSAALASRGGLVVGIEPGEAWRDIAAERVKAAGRGRVVAATGELLPLRDNSIDLVVSLQVLEHVRDPRRVIQEIYRVLRPGGVAFIAYENYLGFWEPHYDVPWFPLLPKSLGALYLKVRRRDPRFLWESITYTTYPSVRRGFLKSGFTCIREQERVERLLTSGHGGIRWRALRAVARINRSMALRMIRTADFASRIFRTYTEEFLRKPPL